MKRTKETKPPSKPAAKADEGDYTPTPAEEEALKAYVVARAKRAPR